jgi:hypothetical protein
LEYLGLQNKPKSELHPGHKLTEKKEERGEGEGEEGGGGEEEEEYFCSMLSSE